MQEGSTAIYTMHTDEIGLVGSSLHRVTARGAFDNTTL
jgi:hypothetical protein